MRSFRAIVLFSVLALIVIGRFTIAAADKTVRRVGIEKMMLVAKAALKRARIGTTRIGGEHAVLAVWKVGTKSVRLVNVRGGRSKTEDFEVALIGKPNGANTRYNVLSPAGWHVLAIRTNVRQDLKARRSMPVIYAPYGEHIDTRSFRKEGRKYLETLVKGAARSLDSLDVASKTDPTARVTKVVPGAYS
jgi:hypothetical protein